MSLELFNVLANLGTFLVIAATTITAVVQLRHMRGSNQIDAMIALREDQDTPEFVKATHFVFGEFGAKMRDADFRHQIIHRAERTAENRPLISQISTVGNYFENMGLFAKNGLVDQDLVLEMYYTQILLTWATMEEYIVLVRSIRGPTIYENFEYLAVKAQDWEAAHPDGAYPKNLRRLKLPPAP